MEIAMARVLRDWLAHGGQITRFQVMQTAEHKNMLLNAICPGLKPSFCHTQYVEVSK